MASVAEIKEGLLADQGKAVEAYNAALSAVSAVSSLAAWVLGGLGLLVALVAILGWWNIYRTAKVKSSEVAKKAANAYLLSDEFAKLLDQKVAEAVAERVRVVDATGDLSPDEDDEDPFPDIEEVK